MQERSIDYSENFYYASGEKLYKRTILLHCNEFAAIQNRANYQKEWCTEGTQNGKRSRDAQCNDAASFRAGWMHVLWLGRREYNRFMPGFTRILAPGNGMLSCRPRSCLRSLWDGTNEKVGEL